MTDRRECVDLEQRIPDVTLTASVCMCMCMCACVCVILPGIISYIIRYLGNG